VSAANLALRFLLELALLAALAYWGAHATASPLLAALLAVLAPLSAAALWGACVSPKARVALPPRGRLAVELCLFALAGAALAAAGQPRLALALAAGVAVHQGWRAAGPRRATR